ncbi:hypothetical protein JZU46_06920 [bacterium]|nr:hypothetical protein [bacterium]
MGIIIGAATTVSFNGGHVTQVSWDINPNIQRAYILGSWSPYAAAELKSPTETLSLTVYSPGPTYDTTPTTSCVDANQVVASVSPAGCGAGSTGPSTSNWFVTSYSYSKGDARSPGTESWSMMNYVTMGDPNIKLPNYVLRGISEGSITSSDPISAAQLVTGIVFTGTPNQGTQGSVSAGQIGRADTQFTGVIERVGNSGGATGDIGNASCSMPYTPLYI